MKLHICIIFLILLILFSCDNWDDRFTIINNTNKTISYRFYSDDSTDEFASKYFSESKYTTSAGEVNYTEYSFIPSQKIGHIGTTGFWEHGGMFENGLGYLYVIDSCDIGKDSTYLKQNYLIRKYVVYLDYMKTHDWKFVVK